MSNIQQETDGAVQAQTGTRRQVHHQGLGGGECIAPKSHARSDGTRLGRKAVGDSIILRFPYCDTILSYTSWDVDMHQCQVRLFASGAAWKAPPGLLRLGQTSLLHIETESGQEGATHAEK